MSDTMVAEHAAEQRRLTALRNYEVLDTDPESDFDDIAVLAAQLCRTPIAAVSLVDEDRQWFKARVGIEICESGREHAFCAHAMYGDDVMQVPDARLDPRFADNPLVTGELGVVFYAGAPLISSTGEPLGSLCVIDREPRLLTPAEVQGLRTLARHVMAQLELRQYARGLDAANERLRDADRIKDEFISRVTHELRTPLTSINGYLEMLAEDGLEPSTGEEFLSRIRRNSDRLMALVDDMLLAAQTGRDELRLTKRMLDLSELSRAAVVRNGVLARTRGLTITADAPEPVFVEADEARLIQVIERLVLNAVKFTPSGGITVSTAAHGHQAQLVVRDTGIGIGPEDRERVMAPFRRSADAERREVQGAGLGLSIVKAIVDGHGGSIHIESEPDQGAAIVVTLPRSTKIL
ncbi:sensor histidine kinase [Paractinoplanes abujensis]|uniref:histidine kinase n=1 Tax=Paractinoplanes abujensis TaxID=882441 RepID=A0A7W7CKF3_9ACTN|nr:GAF domain-containing sensor histidine kinase [Actinoplanes abujensis]MBB4690196.1 signal transduction histidine kinase [Actinoplanes abujensis]GID20961.1 sensor histidine kinase [Actinoplanes abujensis]